MVRWWAAFFIAGIVSPPDGRTSLIASILVACIVLATEARARHGGWMAPDRLGPERFVHALTSFAICSAAAIIIWQTAGLERTARDCSAAEWRNRRKASESRSSTKKAAHERAGGRSEGAIGSDAISSARVRLLNALEDGRLTDRARGFVGALILDDRSGLDFKLSETYSYLGITHFLALSGMHLGAVAIPLSGILSRFIRSRRRSDIVLLAILCLYSAVAGFPVSLLRALFLSASIIAYRFIGMHTDLIGALVAGSWVLVAIDSSIAFDAGFQLSFTAVCGIALIAVPLSRTAEGRLPGGFRGLILKAILFPAIITCSVQFLTMPLVISLFKRASLLSPIVNVLVSLPFTVLLYAGLLYVFIPLGPMRTCLAFGINPLCRFLEAAPGIFARGPHAGLYRGDYHVDAYLGGVALVSWGLQLGCRRRRTILVAGAACIALAFLFPGGRMIGARASGTTNGSSGEESVRRVSCRGAMYLSAGRGIMFLDGRFTSGEAYRFTRSLWAEGVREVGICVVTPSYLRRNNGLFYLLKRIRVDEVLCNPYLFVREADLSERLAKMGAMVKTVRAGDVLSDGRWRLEIFGPVFPPPSRSRVEGKDAALAWRLIAGPITSLDLPSGRRYHAGP